MMAAHSTLSSLVYSEPDIERVFTALNNRLCEKNEEGYFVTAFAGVFCADSKRLIYVNAGHNPPFIKSGESFSQLPCKVNLILGAIKDVEYRAEEILTQSGDILCVYTDGVTEASNPNLEMYSAKRLERTLDDNKNASPKNIAEHVFTDVTNFTGDAEPSDDLTLLCIKFL
jgi:sigma-B regulation protein RsbU (phosphoserine phosphatase)